MLSIPLRSELRKRPIVAARTFLLPLDVVDTNAMWVAVESCRAYLEPWLPWVPFQTDPQSIGRFIDASVLDWDQGYAMRFGIHDRAERQFLGVVSLDSVQHLNLCCDLGYWLRRDVNGKGLMTEAASAVVQWAFACGMHRIRVAAATDNHRSLSVISRLGFRFEGVSRQAEFVAGRWLDHAFFGRLSTDNAASPNR